MACDAQARASGLATVLQSQRANRPVQGSAATVAPAAPSQAAPWFGIALVSTKGSNDVEDKSVEIVYTNWRGETGERHIIPGRIYWGSTEHHKRSQWLMDAYDIDTEADRTFAMKDIHRWSC